MCVVQNITCRGMKKERDGNGERKDREEGPSCTIVKTDKETYVHLH